VRQSNEFVHNSAISLNLNRMGFIHLVQNPDSFSRCLPGTGAVSPEMAEGNRHFSGRINANAVDHGQPENRPSNLDYRRAAMKTRDLLMISR
jgi:hypothetical protein